MSKDFRAKQVRTNKIIGRSDAAVGGSGTKIQLALMKSGSADFAGGITNNDAQETPTPVGVGDLFQNTSKIGTDVWMVVDGASTNRYARSQGESVLFLGDVVVSGTLYVERQRINITTTSLTDNTDNALLLSGSVFVTQDQGLSVGKKVDGHGASLADPFTDTREAVKNKAGSNIALGNEVSIFFDGTGNDAPSGDGSDTYPQGLLVIRPNDNDGTALRGKIGIGVADPDAKLEILATGEQLRLTNNPGEYASFAVDNAGVLTVSTAGSAASDIYLDAAGDIFLDAGDGDIGLWHAGTLQGYWEMNDVATDVWWEDADGVKLYGKVNTTAGGTASSLRMHDAKKLEFRDNTVYIHSHEANGVQMEATGNMLIGSTLADAKSLTLGNALSTHILLSPHGTAANEKILIKNAAGTAVDALKIETTAGGLDIDVGTQITLDAGTTLTATASTGDVNIVAEANNAKVRLRGDNESDVAIHLDGNAAAGSIVDIDAGVLNMDALASINILATTSLSAKGAGGASFGDDVGTWVFDGSGAISETGVTTFDLTPGSTANIDSVGALTIDSSATIGIGTDNVNQAINIGTNGTRTITIGEDGATSTVHIRGEAANIELDAGSNIVNVTGGMTISGNLTVAGSTTQVNSTIVTVADPLMVLGKGNAGTVQDLGLVLERNGSGTNLFMGWDESADVFVVANVADEAGTTAGNIATVTPGTLRVGKLELQDADNFVTQTSGGVEIQSDVSIQLDAPIVDFEDDGVVLQFGDGDDVTLTHVHDAGLLLNTGMQLQFGEAGENISGDNTDLTIASGGDINLTATADVNLPASVGLTFASNSNKIEVDGSNNLEIIAGNDMTFQVGGADGDHFLFRNGADITEETKLCIGNTSTYIERMDGSSNVRFVSDRPILLDTAGTLTLDGNSGVNIKHADQAALGVSRRWDGSAYVETILLANHASDIVFQTAPGGTVTEIARFDTSTSSLRMAGSNTLSFRSASPLAWINSPSDASLQIQTGTGLDPGTIDIGTGASSSRTTSITIGESGVTTTTIHGLALPTVTLDDGSNTASITFGGADPDPVIQRDASGVLTFTDSGGSHTLSSLASGAVAAGTVFTTQGGDPADASANHRNVTASTRRIAIIGSGSVGGVHADEVYGFNGLSAPSDIVFFTSGSIKPVDSAYGAFNGFTPHGAGTEQERRNAAFDCNLISSGSVFLRGLYATNGAGDIVAGSGQSAALPHPVHGAGTGYVLSIDQANARGDSTAADLFGRAVLHGHLQFSYSAPDVRIPSNGLSFTAEDGTGEVMLVKPTGDNAVIIPAGKKLGFANAATNFIQGDGSNNVSVAAAGGLNLSSGTSININSNWTAASQTCANLGTVSAATSITSTAFAGNLTGNVTGDVTGDVTGNADSATALLHTRTFKVDLTSTSASSGFNGGANVTDIGVNGSLGISNGGTGASNATQARTNLGLAIGSDVQAYDAQLADVAGLTPGDGKFIVGDGSNFVVEDGETARASLGLTIGTDVQAYDAELSALAGLTSAADKGIQFTGSGTAATYDLTAAGKALLDDVDAAAQRTTMGVAIGSDVQAYDAQLSTLAGFTADQVTRGIADDNLITADCASHAIANGDFAKFTAVGVEGRSTSEVRSDLGLATSDSPTFAGIVSTGDITITDSDATEGASPTLKLKSTDSDAQDAAVIRFEQNGAIAADTNLGEIYWYGDDDSNNTAYPGAAIIAEGDGDWTDNSSHPTRLKFATATTSDAVPAERMVIKHNGRVGIGLSDPSHELSVNGTVGASYLSATTLYNAALKVGRDTDNLFDFSTDNEITVRCNNQDQLKFNDGAILPIATDIDLGSSSNRFANIYTNDLNLCNEGRGNDVDGTSGNWTIQEGAENLYVINNLTGKKYKMALTPVEE